MKIFICLFMLLNFSALAGPMTVTQSCEGDFDKDGQKDLAIIVSKDKEASLIVLLKTKNGVVSQTLDEKAVWVTLSCEKANAISETSAGKGKKDRVVHKTNGEYISLTQAESSKVAYFWKKDKFVEIWLVD